MTNKITLTQKTLNAVLGVAFLIALAIGLGAFMAVQDGVLIILWVVLAVMGVALAALSFLYEDRPGDFGPSESNYRFAVGSLMLIAGLIGYMFTYSSAETLVTVIVAVVAIAILALIMIIKNRM